MDIDLLSANELKKWAKWAATVEQTLTQAETAVESGQIFFTKENLRPLCKKISIGKDKEQFLEFLKKLPS